MTDGNDPAVLDRSIVADGVEIGLGSATERYGRREMYHRTTCASGSPSGTRLVKRVVTMDSERLSPSGDPETLEAVVFEKRGS